MAWHGLAGGQHVKKMRELGAWERGEAVGTVPILQSESIQLFSEIEIVCKLAAWYRRNWTLSSTWLCRICKSGQLTQRNWSLALHQLFQSNRPDEETNSAA